MRARTIFSISQTYKLLAREGVFVQVWPEKWEKPRVWLPNLREMWVTRLVAAGLARFLCRKGWRRWRR